MIIITLRIFKNIDDINYIEKYLKRLMILIASKIFKKIDDNN